MFLSCRASRASDGGHRISRPGGPARCVCLNQLGQGGRSARGAERGSPVVFFFFPQPRGLFFGGGALLSGWRRAGDWWVWAPFKGLPCTLDFWRYSRRSGKGKRCVTLGLPGHGCILLITLGVGGIVCDYSGCRSFTSCVNKVKPCSRELSQRLNSLAGISRPRSGPGT